MTKHGEAKQSKTERLEKHIAELRARMKLDNWSEFVRGLQVPGDLYPAIQTGRHQLMPKGRALSSEECQVVYNIIATLLETNAALREHTEQTAILVDEWKTAFKGLDSLADHIRKFANMIAAEDEEVID